MERRSRATGWTLIPRVTRAPRSPRVKCRPPRKVNSDELIAIFIPVLGQYWMSEYQRKLEVVIWKDTNRIRTKKEVFSRS